LQSNYYLVDKSGSSVLLQLALLVAALFVQQGWMAQGQKGNTPPFGCRTVALTHCGSGTVLDLK